MTLIEKTKTGKSEASLRESVLRQNKLAAFYHEMAHTIAVGQAKHLPGLNGPDALKKLDYSHIKDPRYSVGDWVDTKTGKNSIVRVSDVPGIKDEILGAIDGYTGDFDFFVKWPILWIVDLDGGSILNLNMQIK